MALEYVSKSATDRANKVGKQALQNLNYLAVYNTKQFEKVEMWAKMEELGIIIIIFHETHAAFRLWRGYIHFGIETLCCPYVSPVSYQTFCRGPPIILF